MNYAALLQPVLNQVVILIIGALGAALLYYVKLGVDYIKGKIGADKYEKIKGYVVSLVKSYAQNPIFRDLDNEAKKEAVLAKATAFAEGLGLPITYEMLDTWLEEAMQELNKDLKTFIEAPLPVDPVIVAPQG